MGVGGGNGRSLIGKEKKNGYKKEGGRRGGEYTTSGNRGRGRVNRKMKKVGILGVVKKINKIK
jgi:hypothetical protein